MTAGTFDSVAATLARETKGGLATLTAAVYIGFALTDAVDLQPPKGAYLFTEAKITLVLYPSFGDVAREHTKNREHQKHRRQAIDNGIKHI